MVYNWINYIQSSLFPPLCLLCNASSGTAMNICEACLDALPHNLNCCKICALQLSQPTSERLVCGNCLKQTPPFDSCHAAFSYGYPISNLISAFKFSGKLQNGRLLARLLINSIESSQQPMPDLILPVPLHRSRLRDRGFNQALELAQPLGRHFHIPVDTHSCERTRATEAQSNLDKRWRRKNVRNAFKLRQAVEHEHVVIIDDVVTTGNTVSELARMLKLDRVKRVDVWTLARTASLP